MRMARDSALAKVARLKRKSFSEAKTAALPVRTGEGGTVSLVPIGPWILAETEIINLMVVWRKQAMSMFLAQFESTYGRTRSYLENLAISDQNRILFLIMIEGRIAGHIGFSNIRDREAELDNVMKSSQPVIPGLMREASTALIDWGFRELDVRSIRLQVTSHNEPAQALYRRLGFKVESLSALRVEVQGDVVLHVPCAPEESNVPFQLVIMRLNRDSFEANRMSHQYPS